MQPQMLRKVTLHVQEHTDGRALGFQSILCLHVTRPCTDTPLPDSEVGALSLTCPWAHAGSGKDIGSAETGTPQNGLSWPQALMVQQWGRQSG